MSMTTIPQQGGALLPQPHEWETLRSMAKVAIESGLLPPHVKSEQAAIFIAMKGRELAIPTTYAWSNIAVISGKPVCSAELMLALIYRDHGGQAIAFEETTDVVCRVTYQRRDVAGARAFAYTAQQARTAGLTGGNWAKYPAAMLRARCVSAVARLAFADTIAGMYLPDEVGAAVTVTPEGEVVMADSEPVAAEPAAPVAEPAPDPELAAARAALTDAMNMRGWRLPDLLGTAASVWPHVRTKPDLESLTAFQLRRLTDVLLGESYIDAGGRIMPAEVTPEQPSIAGELAEAMR